jgi:hypothetical protein
MTDFYVLSQRQLRQDPAIGCLIEFEDVLIEACSATLITPTWIKQSRLEKLSPWHSPYRVEIPNATTNSEQVLIITGMDWGICEVLKVIPEWRKRFDIVCVYILDAFMPRLPRHRSVSRFSRLVSTFDHIFIPMTDCAETYQQAFEIPVSFLPYACNVTKFGSNSFSRPIDVIGYGRQHTLHSQLLSDHYNSLESDRLYYFTSHMNIGNVNDFYAHRSLFWKILQRSKIALSYDPISTNPERFPFSFITQRWFECLTAGCLVVGKRPNCSEADYLLNWQDSTIEMPDDSDNVIPFLEDLLADKERLNSAHQRNYLYCLASHDWCHRIAEMLDRLSLDHPEPLQRSLEGLNEIHARTQRFSDYLELDKMASYAKFN